MYLDPLCSPTEKPPPEQSTYREDMIQLKQNEDFFRDVVLEVYNSFIIYINSIMYLGFV